MKKSLLALAALSAIAGTAQAQSSVTLFGALDAGGYYANNIPDKFGKATGQAWGVLSNTVVTSNWGLKGTEDLGGGTKANFYAESGINLRNGGLSQTGGEAGVGVGGVSSTLLFDRGLTVGASGNWGAVDIGNKLNPFFASHGAILPVSGNSVSTNAAASLGYFLPFVHNSITYTAPTMAGFNAQLQYGTGNVVNSSSGATLAAAADYTVGGLNVRAAYEYLAKGGTALSANNINAAYGSPLVTYTASGGALGTITTTTTSPSVQTYLIGAKYNTGPFTVGAGWVANSVSAYTGTIQVLNTTKAYNLNNYQVGFGYQATPAILLGLSWIGATSGSNLINAQARYAFSKRTQAYGQFGYAVNNNGLAANGLNVGNFSAISGSNGSQMGTGGTLGAPKFNQAAFGVGLIHTF